MDPITHPDVANSLALAILASSAAPTVLLDQDLTVIAASLSFYRTLGLRPRDVAGQRPLQLGEGDCDIPQLPSLLNATLSGQARIETYEMDLEGVPLPAASSSMLKSSTMAMPNRSACC